MDCNSNLIRDCKVKRIRIRIGIWFELESGIKLDSRIELEFECKVLIGNQFKSIIPVWYWMWNELGIPFRYNFMLSVNTRFNYWIEKRGMI